MLASGHGAVGLLCDGLFPGRALTDVLIERRFQNPHSFAHLSNWREACLGGGKVAGAVYAPPFSNYSSLPGDPLITAERRRSCPRNRGCVVPHTAG